MCCCARKEDKQESCDLYKAEQRGDIRTPMKRRMHAHACTEPPSVTYMYDVLCGDVSFASVAGTWRDVCFVQVLCDTMERKRQPQKESSPHLHSGKKNQTHERKEEPLQRAPDHDSGNTRQAQLYQEQRWWKLFRAVLVAFVLLVFLVVAMSFWNVHEWKQECARRDEITLACLRQNTDSQQMYESKIGSLQNEVNECKKEYNAAEKRELEQEKKLRAKEHTIEVLKNDSQKKLETCVTEKKKVKIEAAQCNRKLSNWKQEHEESSHSYGLLLLIVAVPFVALIGYAWSRARKWC